MPWVRRLIAGLSPRRLGFDPGSVHVGFVVDEVALGQVFPRVLRFYPVNFIPPVLHYLEKWKQNLIIFITGLHNKPLGWGASVASAAGPFTTTQKKRRKWVLDDENWFLGRGRCLKIDLSSCALQHCRHESKRNEVFLITGGSVCLFTGYLHSHVSRHFSLKDFPLRKCHVLRYGT